MSPPSVAVIMVVLSKGYRGTSSVRPTIFRGKKCGFPRQGFAFSAAFRGAA